MSTVSASLAEAATSRWTEPPAGVPWDDGPGDTLGSDPSGLPAVAGDAPEESRLSPLELSSRAGDELSSADAPDVALSRMLLNPPPRLETRTGIATTLFASPGADAAADVVEDKVNGVVAEVPEDPDIAARGGLGPVVSQGTADNL